VLGDRALGRRIRAMLRRLAYGAPLPRSALKEIGEVRTRMELELGKETPGRLHVKLGRGGLVDVEFLTQALQLVHGAAHPDVRRSSTTAALAGLARIGALAPATAATLRDDYRFLRRVSTALRLLGARPTDTLELAGPMPARVASALDFPSRDAFLKTYRERTTAIRATYEDVVGRSHAPSETDRAPVERSRQGSSERHPRSSHDNMINRKDERSRHPSRPGHPRPDASKGGPLQ
jgi:[glutamine synthetase] adenylyltransferase / [glutamine synthetase]-adenylyl-L-tyrosine phosphorylase